MPIILDELWCGNISPLEQCTHGGKRIKELLPLECAVDGCTLPSADGRDDNLWGEEMGWGQMPIHSFAFTPQKALRCSQRKGVSHGYRFVREKQRLNTKLHF